MVLFTPDFAKESKRSTSMTELETPQKKNQYYAATFCVSGAPGTGKTYTWIRGNTLPINLKTCGKALVLVPTTAVWQLVVDNGVKKDCVRTVASFKASGKNIANNVLLVLTEAAMNNAEDTDYILKHCSTYTNVIFDFDTFQHGPVCPPLCKRLKKCKCKRFFDSKLFRRRLRHAKCYFLQYNWRLTNPTVLSLIQAVQNSFKRREEWKHWLKEFIVQRRTYAEEVPAGVTKIAMTWKIIFEETERWAERKGFTLDKRTHLVVDQECIIKKNKWSPKFGCYVYRNGTVGKVKKINNPIEPTASNPKGKKGSVTVALECENDFDVDVDPFNPGEIKEKCVTITDNDDGSCNVVPAFIKTTHWAQGMTLDSAVGFCDGPITAPGLYVMLSRSNNLQFVFSDIADLCARIDALDFDEKSMKFASYILRESLI